MAVQNPLSITLRLEYEAGYNGLGKAIIKRKNFTNIAMGVTNDALFATGQAIASLQNYTLLEVARIDSSALLA